MSELIPHPEQKYFIDSCERIGYDALMEVTGRYGFGDPKVDTVQPPEIFPLAYHNAQHTLRIRQDTARIAHEHGLTDYDTALAVMIASAHDLYHDKIEGESDEEKSAQWLIEQMQRARFSEEDMEIARLAVLGTTPLVDTEGNLISQQFTLTSFPSQRAGEIALCVAAADLAALFSPIGPTCAHELLLERLGCPSTHLPGTLDGVEAFQRQQIAFLQNYQPLYPALEQFWGDLRAEIVSHHTDLLCALRAGEITDWQQVLAADTAFYHARTQ